MTFQKAKARLGVLGYQDPRLTEVNTDASKKISRVGKSTLSAAAFSMSRTVDKMRWCRLLWGTLIIPEFQWRSLPDAFRQMHAAVIVTDCKSLFHLVSRRAMPSFEEYRTTLEVLLKKERCMEHCFFRWIPTSLQLADPLTKNMDHRFFEQYWNKGHFNYLMRQQVFKRMHTGNQLYKG